LGQAYRDGESAKAKRETAIKRPLTCSHFIREFEYGYKGEGYWSYEHMVIQLEDCIDCLKVLYLQYDFVFLLDHSCGHDQQREDGLNAGKMSKTFGGRQKILRDMAIKQENGYLGPFKRTLKVGDVQTMRFQSTDEGLFWMTPEEKEQNRKDIIIHTKTKIRKYTKDELRGFLEAKGVFVKGNLSALHSTCQQNGIVIKEKKNKVIEGWEGKAKGMLQVLWERGFVNTAEGEKKAYQNYSIKGYNDQFGNHRPETSLKELMSSCKDFVEEEMMLQSIAHDLGVRVDRTPKYHCELAGECIEYAWACSKNKYRSILLENKRGKENFVSSIRSCISREHITRERAQKFAKRDITCCTNNSQTRIAAERTAAAAAAAAKMRQSCLSNWSKW